LSYSPLNNFAILRKKPQFFKVFYKNGAPLGTPFP
jgi:hypothetical protein